MRPVRGLLDRMIARWQPEQIWLFGSRARGAAGSDSDWDFLVVVPDRIPDADLDPLLVWRLQRDAQVTADIVPCRATDFDDFRNTPNTLFFEVSKSGVVVYER
jgi:predicted nucleotidyltransferase